MRIGLAVDGTRGDVHPMLALGEHWAAAGHEVVCCAPSDARAEVESRGLEFRSVGIDVQAFLEKHAGALAAGGFPLMKASGLYFRETCAKQFARLPEATRDVDRLFGGGVLLAGQTAADLHGIPYRFIAFCPALYPSAEHPPGLLPIQSMPPWANRLGWSLFRRAAARLVGREVDRQRCALGLPRVRDHYRHFVSERPLLAADFGLAPLPADCPFAVEQISCLHRLTEAELPSKLQTFLDAGPAPLFFGFGSMTDPDPERTTRLILDAVDRLGFRAIISQGWAGLGADALPGNVAAVGSVPHSALFPRCAAVIHHGGAGTTTTAARAGVPQIVVPHGADQFYWARRVNLLGLGPPALRRNRLDTDGLCERLAMLRDNELLYERAREHGERLRTNLALRKRIAPEL